MNEDIYEIIVLKITGATSKEQDELLNEWLEEKNNRLIYHALSQHLSNDGLNEYASREKVFRRISERIHREPTEFSVPLTRRIRIQEWLKVAAVLVLMVGFSMIMFRNEDQSVQTIAKSVEIQKINPKGQKSSFVLSDGTLVKLNADSRLTFLEKFNTDSRVVVLTGEAFFDVKKDPHRPFIVKSGNISTQALGTSFNVRAYPDEQSTRVALVTGKVRIEHNSGTQVKQQFVILNPMDLATVDKNSKEILKDSFNPEIELAWKNRTLYFENMDFGDMVRTLERWYGVSFEIKNGSDIRTKFTGKFEDRSLEYVLNVLSKNGEYFSFSIRGDKIIITKQRK